MCCYSGKVQFQENRHRITEALLSERLAEIRNLSDLTAVGYEKRISQNLANRCKADFLSSTIGVVLSQQCGIEQRVADLFAKHLLVESIDNALEHPNASMGMVAVSQNGVLPELLVVVADNGDSILETILREYNARKKTSYAIEEVLAGPLQLRADILDFATQPGVTRKTPVNGHVFGMGLTYIKEDTVTRFHGSCRFLSSSAYITYKDQVERPASREDLPHTWRGNLLRLSIPLKPRDCVDRRIPGQ